MKYITFLLKKVRNEKMNILPFLLILFFIVFMYAGNHKQVYQSIENPMYSGEDEIEHMEADVERFEAELESLNVSNEAYNNTLENLNRAKDKLHYAQERLTAIKTQNWYDYYTNDANLTGMTLQTFEEADMYYKDTIDSLKLNKAYDEYMAEHGLRLDSRFSGSQGISYTLNILHDFFPVLFTILLIFLLSRMYCSAYIEKIDIQAVLPYSRLKKQCLRLCSGILLGLCVVLFIFIVSILCGTIGNTFGSLASPVLTYTSQGTNIFLPFSLFLLKILILIFLSILFIVNFVSVVSKVTQKNMTCLLISLGVILGCLLVLQDIAPLHDYMHFFPTTYINVLKVVSGELANTMHNVKITFSNGVIFLLITNCFLFVVDMYLPRLRFRSVKS